MESRRASRESASIVDGPDRVAMPTERLRHAHVAGRERRWAVRAPEPRPRSDAPAEHSRFQAQRTQARKAMRILGTGTLGDIPLFKDCSPMFLEELTGVAHLEALADGQVLCDGASFTEQIYVLRQGDLELAISDEVSPTELGPVVGAAMVMRGIEAAARRHAVIRAKGNCICMAISREALARSFLVFPSDAKLLESEVRHLLPAQRRSISRTMVEEPARPSTMRAWQCESFRATRWARRTSAGEERAGVGKAARRTSTLPMASSLSAESRRCGAQATPTSSELRATTGESDDGETLPSWDMGPLLSAPLVRQCDDAARARRALTEPQGRLDALAATLPPLDLDSPSSLALGGPLSCHGRPERVSSHTESASQGAATTPLPRATGSPKERRTPTGARSVPDPPATRRSRRDSGGTSWDGHETSP